VHGQKIAAHNNEKPRQTFKVVDAASPPQDGFAVANLADSVARLPAWRIRDRLG